jgi:hypothetical protein
MSTFANRFACAIDHHERSFGPGLARGGRFRRALIASGWPHRAGGKTCPAALP